MELEPEDIINYCRLSKKFNRAVCENRNFWLARLRDQPDYLFNVVVGFTDGEMGYGAGDFVIGLSKYIPNADVITLIQSITSTFIQNEGVANNIARYRVEYNGETQCDSPTLDRECFSQFNRNTPEVTIVCFLENLTEDPELESWGFRKKLNLILRDKMNEYKESLRGTRKEFLLEFL